METYWIVTCLLCAMIGIVAPQDPAELRERGDAARNYFMKYCYMGSCSPDASTHGLTGTDMQSSAMKAIIKRFQNMANLPITGELDSKTMDKMQEDRCGFPDIVSKTQSTRKRRYVIPNTVKWGRNKVMNLTYNILKYPNGLRQRDVDSEIKDAFFEWFKYIPVVFTGISSNRPNVADIDIIFDSGSHGDSYPFDGPGGTLAHAFTPGRGRGGDVHFDADENWGINIVSGGPDVFVVSLHELGHSLGLGHTNVPGAVMSPFYNPAHNELQMDDIMGAQAIYGERDTRPPPDPPAPPVDPGVTNTPTPRPNPNTPIPPPDPSLPDLVPAYCSCSCGTISAMLVDNQDRTFGFACGLVYQFNRVGVEDGYPKAIHEVFPQMKYEVDAAEKLSTSDGDAIFLFSKSYVFTYDAWTLFPIHPKRRIRDVFRGVPNSIDTMFRWTGNGKVYAMKGGQYYQINERELSAGPALNIDRWELPFNNIKAAFLWNVNRKNYFFFANNMYVRYHTTEMKVDLEIRNPYPRRVKTWWLACRDATSLTQPGFPEHDSDSDSDFDFDGDVPETGFGVGTFSPETSTGTTQSTSLLLPILVTITCVLLRS